MSHLILMFCQLAVELFRLVVRGAMSREAHIKELSFGIHCRKNVNILQTNIENLSNQLLQLFTLGQLNKFLRSDIGHSEGTWEVDCLFRNPLHYHFHCGINGVSRYFFGFFPDLDDKIVLWLINTNEIESYSKLQVVGALGVTQNTDFSCVLVQVEHFLVGVQTTISPAKSLVRQVPVVEILNEDSTDGSRTQSLSDKQLVSTGINLVASKTYFVIVDKDFAMACLHGVVIFITNDNSEGAGARLWRNSSVRDGNWHKVSLLFFPVKSSDSFHLESVSNS